MDFYKLRTKRTKDGVLVYPDFVVQNSKDLLVKGRAFYAVWDEVRGLWSRDEMDVARIIDADLYRMAEEVGGSPLLMSSFESKSWTQFKNYVGTLDDSNVELDLALNFADAVPDRKKFSSKKLDYALVDIECPAWDELCGTLYNTIERQKIEWAIGSIIAGDSKKNQKFLVFYGASGKGKSTIIGIMEKLFEGYYIPIRMKELGSSNNGFSMVGFKNNPLLAIEHDGDLSRIEDNTRLNSIVSHELMPINEKFKSEYYSRIYAFLVLGTNEPVRITGSKSGLLRRLIDVHPSGDIIENRRYHALVNQIDFELGAIANHCLGVYLSLGKNYYSNYKPTMMMYETDVFYNFVEHAYDLFYTQDGVQLTKAWQMYKEFCEDALIRHRLALHQFRTELQHYFDTYEERAVIDGQRIRGWFSGFKNNRFVKIDETKPISLSLDETESLIDSTLAEMPAQYATSSGTPKDKWESVTTKLSDLDTTQLHYVQVPEQHIVIDFDLKDEHGDKSLERNLEEASEWPPTYTEYSQGGAGVHLHYIYSGDVSELKALYKEGIEVKTLLGNSSLRRRLSRCNNIPVATITSGLPLKEKPVHDAKAMSSEKAVRKLIEENLRKEHMPGTKPSIDFIKKILDEAYEAGFAYDVSDMHADVFSFAMGSSNKARYCMDVVKTMSFMSESMELQTTAENDTLVFYDVEVFPNLFIVCWKAAGDERTVVRMVNPSPSEIDDLIKRRLVGFNCRRYDNHILYARAMGESVEQLYERSQRIINNDKSAMFGAAYDISYVDIYDYSSKKQSLKKFEIELGLKHSELGLPWDEPVPGELWEKVTDYCCDDVLATESTHEARQADFMARLILAELSGMSVNSSTQMHTARIIFGTEKKPQKQFLYTHLNEMFPGYEYDFGKSTYRDEIVGEGGYVYAEPGSYHNVALLDVASMHPTSIELLDLFGPYTEKFSELKQARIAIKRGDYDSARRMLDGKLGPYLEDEEMADALSYALKIVINIVYGLTSASFENAFRDPRNKDNIVAKRGALFMIDLKHYVQEELGLQVVHIKTDSIKVPNASDDQIKAIMDFGTKYGYEFEHEATYPDFVLFNDAVYIARDEKQVWHATGAQFQHPYVFKKLLSGEEIVFDDLCETRNVVKGEIRIVNDTADRFVGRIGRFVPLLLGSGGGALIRRADVVLKDDEGNEHVEKRDYAVTGSKGFEWLEAEFVKDTELENKIDYSYFDNLVKKAEESLIEFGFYE